MMKKILLVLFFSLAVLSLYAVNHSTGTVNAVLYYTPIFPSYTIYCGLDGVHYSTMGSSNYVDNDFDEGSPHVLAVDYDLGVNDFVVYVKVVQFGTAHYKSVEGFDLSISATELKLNGTSDVYKTGLPSVLQDSSLWDSPITVDSDGDYEDDYISTRTSIVGPEVTYRVSYPTGDRVRDVENAASVAVGGFAYKWSAVETLPIGKYHGFITMAFTVE